MVKLPRPVFVVALAASVPAILYIPSSVLCADVCYHVDVMFVRCPTLGINAMHQNKSHPHLSRGHLPSLLGNGIKVTCQQVKPRSFAGLVQVLIIYDAIAGQSGYWVGTVSYLGANIWEHVTSLGADRYVRYRVSPS